MPRIAKALRRISVEGENCMLKRACRRESPQGREERQIEGGSGRRKFVGKLPSFECSVLSISKYNSKQIRQKMCNRSYRRQSWAI